MKKKIKIFFLGLVLFAMSAVAYGATDNYMKIDEFRDGEVYEAPERGGKIFAGWYEDADFTIPLDYETTTGHAYAKFVDPNVFTVKFQLRKGTDTMSADTDLRMITTVDSEHYYSIGFAMERNGVEGKQPLLAESIYKTIHGFEQGQDKPYEPTIFSNESAYFAVQKLKGLDGSYFADAFKVTPIYETMDGTVIRGTERTVRINENVRVAEGTVTDVDVPDNNLRFRLEENVFSYPTGVSAGTAFDIATKNAAYQIEAISGGVYVNGATTPVDAKIAKFDARTYVIHWERCGLAQPKEGTVVKIDGRFGNSTHSLNLGPVYFVYDETRAEWIMWNKEVNLVSYADNNSYPYNELRMVSDVSDELTYGYYGIRYGNVWLDGKILNCNLLCHPGAKGYYIQGNYLTDAKKGSEIIIDGIVGTDAYSVKLNRQTFMYDGTQWITADKVWNMVEDGESSYVIVRGANASASEVTAANELQKYIKKISGANIPVVTDATAATAQEIVVGKTNREVAGQFDRAKLGDEGYNIEAFGSKLWIVGGEKRGTLYGVYAYLENYLDCRFYMTGVEKIPEKKTIAISNIYDEYLPVFEYRGASYGGCMETDIGVKRNYNSALSGRNLPESVGGGIANVFGTGGHTFYSFVDPNVYGEEHPEWFSKDSSGNYAQLCLTNPDVLDLIKKGALEWVKQDPTAQMVAVSQNDIQSPCLCDNCVAVYREEGGAYSGTIVRMVNEVAEYLAENGYPDKKVLTYAYQYSRSAPTKTKPHENVVIDLCIIEGCFAHPHEADCAVTANQSYVDKSYGSKGGSNSFEEDLAAWTAICDNVHIYDYDYNVWHSGMYFPSLQNLRSNVALYARYGAEGIKFEGVKSLSPEFAELRTYLYSKLMADPYMTEEEYYAHMDDFLVGVYGEGGKYIREYIDIATEQVQDIHFGLTPVPDELYPTSVVQKHAVTEFPSDLTPQMVRNYKTVDWSRYWNWCTDVTENPLTAEGEPLFKRAMELADDEQKKRIEEIYSQVQYVQSYYYKKKIEEGKNTFTSMLSVYIATRANEFSGQTVDLAHTITNYALAELYSDYIDFNKALMQKYVNNAYSNYRPGGWGDTRYWQNFDFSRVPMNWYQASVATNMDAVDVVDTHLWFKTDSKDTLAYNGNWSQTYWAMTGGVYVDGKKVDTPLIKLYSDRYIIRLPILDEGKPIPYGTTVTVDGVFGAVNTGKVNSPSQVEDKITGLKFNATTFVYMSTESGGKWVEAPHVTVTDDTTKDTCLRFSTSADDKLASSSDYLNKSSYSAIYGGIRIDGTLRNDVKLSKYASNQYIIYWPSYGVTPTKGMKVEIDGIFGTASGLIRLDEAFIYDGEGNWYQNIKVRLNGLSDTALWIYTDWTDPLPHSTAWTERYEVKMGQITVDGTIVNEELIKLYADTYLLVIRGDANSHGKTVMVDVVYGDDANSYWIGPVTFKYDATVGPSGVWVQLEEEDNIGEPRIPITNNGPEEKPEGKDGWDAIF